MPVGAEGRRSPFLNRRSSVAAVYLNVDAGEV
jgi:hypothetical protein